MLIISVTTDDLAQGMAAALRREFGELGCAVQRIAGAMTPPADPRAVRNWWEARNAPSSAQMMRLGQLSAEVRIELLGILAAQQSRNEDTLKEAMNRHEALLVAAGRLGNPGLAVPETTPAPRADDRFDQET